MVVRIRFCSARKNPDAIRIDRRAASMLALLSPPATMAVSVMGLWSITSELNWTREFVFKSGLLSHWQVWIGSALTLQIVSHLLNRYGSGGGATT